MTAGSPSPSTPTLKNATDDWLALFRAADIAAQPCNTLESLPRDPHLHAVGLVQMEDHPTEGKVAAIRSTIRFDQNFPELRSPSSPRGWDTRTVLTSLGLADQTIQELLLSGAVLESVDRQAKS